MQADENQVRAVISLGGSILAPDEIDPSFVRSVADLLARVAGDSGLMVVTGGGRTARRYIAAGREIGATEFALDELGIAASRLNAALLASALPRQAPPEVPRDMPRALELARKYPVVVMGGTHPGHTTDTVAALLAEATGASLFVNATSVDGVYDKDPATHDDARHIPVISHSDLVRICMDSSAGAGPNVVLDPQAARVLARTGMEGAVVDGRDLKALEAALTGADFKGTRITSREGA